MLLADTWDMNRGDADRILEEERRKRHIRELEETTRRCMT